MAPFSDGEGNVDIYFVERRGRLRMYDASANAVITLGELPVVWQLSDGGKQDNGLMGLALDPDFRQNRWIYLMHTPSGVPKDVFRLSRFTLADNKVDFSSEKVLLDIPVDNDTQVHFAGSMAFDYYGDLWVTIGKNCTDDPGSIDEDNSLGSCENSSSDTHDMRGSAIRIHPEPDGTYSIPRGNFGEYYALLYEKQGDPARAAEFRDTSRVRPEVYVKGARNPFNLALEPVKRWLAWGENGINRGEMHEEHNLTKIPGFFGFPYFAGHPDVTLCPDGTLTCFSAYNISAKMSTPIEMDPMTPVNKSRWNTGLVNLPPAIPAIHTYKQASAMTGPIYRYDGDLESSVKFPPHFDGKWFLFDFRRGGIRSAYNQNLGITAVALLDENAEAILEMQDIFQAPAFEFHGPLDFEIGPDGALYILHYSGDYTPNPFSSFSRIEYTGECHPAEPRLEEKVNPEVYYPPPGYGCLEQDDPNYDAEALAHDPAACANAASTISIHERHDGDKEASLLISIFDSGPYLIKMLDVRGQLIASVEGKGADEYDLSRLIRKQSVSGIYIIHVATSAGTVTRKKVVY
jgi:cytochrome c